MAISSWIIDSGESLLPVPWLECNRSELQLSGGFLSLPNYLNLGEVQNDWLELRDQYFTDIVEVELVVSPMPGPAEPVVYGITIGSEVTAIYMTSGLAKYLAESFSSRLTKRFYDVALEYLVARMASSIESILKPISPFSVFVVDKSQSRNVEINSSIMANVRFADGRSEFAWIGLGPESTRIIDFSIRTLSQGLSIESGDELVIAQLDFANNELIDLIQDGVKIVPKN